MFQRRIKQSRKGKTYTYHTLCETARTADGRVRQRTICYLGRLDNLKPPDWLGIAERLPDPAWLPLLMEEVGYAPPAPRDPARPDGNGPSGPVGGVCIDPHSIAWSNPRRVADVFVGLRAWQLLGLDKLFERLLPKRRTRVRLHTLAAMIAVNRLVEPRTLALDQ